MIDPPVPARSFAGRWFAIRNMPRAINPHHRVKFASSVSRAGLCLAMPAELTRISKFPSPSSTCCIVVNIGHIHHRRAGRKTF